MILNQAKPAAKLATIFGRWKDADQSVVVELTKNVQAGKGIPRFESARAEFRLAVIASRFGEMLKETRYGSDTSFEDLSRMAQTVRRQLPSEQTNELVDLIDRASSLAGYFSDDDSRDDHRDYRGDANYKR